MQTSTNEGIQSKYVEPKGWEEITSDEKIERLREMVKSLQSSLRYQSSENRKLIDDFEKHSHDGDKIKVPYNRYSNSSNSLIGECSGALSNIKPYF